MPQPVDFQTEVAKTTVAQRVQDIADRAAMLAQQRLAAEGRRNEAQAETRVGETPESENAEIREDGRGGQDQQPGRRKKRAPKPTAAAEHAATRDADGEHHLDVSV